MWYPCVSLQCVLGYNVYLRSQICAVLTVFVQINLLNMVVSQFVFSPYLVENKAGKNQE